MAGYEQYFLVENPFPEVATLDPTSPDRRINGEIFSEEIVKDEIKSITEKIQGKVNVVYVAGLEFDKGVGKSALVAHEWRRLKQEGPVTVPYLKCKSKQRPADFCDGLVGVWSDQHHVWRAFGNILRAYAGEASSKTLTLQAVELMLKTYPSPPESIPYTRYLHLTRIEGLARAIGDWMNNMDSRINPKYATFFIEQNLTRPADFHDGYVGLKISGLDRIDLYKQTLLCLKTGKYQYHYLFLDQFEDAIMPVSSSGMADFCLGMRRIIEASQGLAIILVTLHPDSETKLGLPGATDLVKIAPVDNYHRVDVMALRTDGNDAIALAVPYIDAHRQGKPPYRTFPLREEVIRYACFLEGGNIRRTLQKLHVCLKVAADKSLPEITMEHVKADHRELMGTEVQGDLLAKFDSSTGPTTKFNPSV